MKIGMNKNSSFNDCDSEFKRMSYNEHLTSDTAFRNPYALELMQASYKVTDHDTLLCREEYPKTDYWGTLRNMQDTRMG